MTVEKNNKPYDASIIIPSYGQKVYISQALDSLSSQDTEYSYEIIVVESSGDGTAELVQQRFPQVKIVKLAQRTHPGTARNLGIKAAQSDILLFTDTDCIADRNWVQRMVDNQQQGKLALGGLVNNGTNKNIIGTADYLLEFYDFLCKRKKTRIGPIPTCNVSYHRSLFEKHGYFVDHIKGSDSVFSRKIAAAGQVIHWDPQIKIWHQNRTSLKKVIKNQFELGIGAAVSRRKYPLRGKVFVRYNFLIPFMPILRSATIGGTILRNSPINFIRFMLVYPLIFVGLLAFTFGFTRGLRVE